MRRRPMDGNGSMEVRMVTRIGPCVRKMRFWNCIFFFENLDEPALLNMPTGASVRLTDGRWVATDKETRNYFVCSNQPPSSG